MKSTESQLANLKKGHRFNSETGRAAGKKGQPAMLRKRREKVAMKEALDFLLQLPWFDPESAPMEEIKSFSQAINSATNMTVQQKMLVAMCVAAVKGNVRAAEFIRDTIGQTILPDKTAGQLAEYEDDGFTEAIKASAVDVWGERHGHKRQTANKAGGKVQPLQLKANAAADVVDAEITVPKS